MFSTPVSLKSLTLHVVSVPHVVPFRSAIGERRERKALLLRWLDKDNDWGIAECSCRLDPYFNGEFLEGAISVLREFAFPDIPPYGSIKDVVSAVSNIRGWNFTIAALMDAMFDLLRRKGMLDPYRGWSESPISRIPAGISLPIFDSAEAAIECIEKAMAAGYHRVKLKVSPRMNLDVLNAVRHTFPSIYLGFDANGSCGANDQVFLNGLAGCRPDVFEQPFAPDRIDLCIALKESQPDLNICLDESINGLGSLKTAHQLGALDELNLKPGRVGGLLPTLDILQYCRLHQIPVWVGGMFETEIGRAANLRVAARLPDAKAHDLRPPSYYLNTSLVEYPIEMDEQGYILFDDAQLITPDEDVISRLCTQECVLTKSVQ